MFSRTGYSLGQEPFPWIPIHAKHAFRPRSLTLPQDSLVIRYEYEEDWVVRWPVYALERAGIFEEGRQSPVNLISNQLSGPRRSRSKDAEPKETFKYSETSSHGLEHCCMERSNINLIRLFPNHQKSRLMTIRSIPCAKFNNVAASGSLKQFLVIYGSYWPRLYWTMEGSVPSDS